MKNYSNSSGKEIERHENELKGLLSRVMREPLEPLFTEISQLKVQADSLGRKLSEGFQGERVLIDNVVQTLRKIRDEIDETKSSVGCLGSELKADFETSKREILSFKDELSKDMSKSFQGSMYAITDGFESLSELMSKQDAQNKMALDSVLSEVKAMASHLEKRYWRLQMLGVVGALLMLIIFFFVSIGLHRDVLSDKLDSAIGNVIGKPESIAAEMVQDGA